MIVERFVALEDLQESSAELTTALQTLLATYQRWVEQQLETSTDDDSGVDFLTLMHEYADERVVFMSPSRESITHAQRNTQLQRRAEQPSVEPVGLAFPATLWS